MRLERLGYWPVARRACPKLYEMNSVLTASAVARELGTSVPRVTRAAKRLGYDHRTGKGPLLLSHAQASRLRAELGRRGRVAEMPSSQLAALAALVAAPYGLPSARAVAEAAGLSPATASKAVKSLLTDGFVFRRPELIAAGRPRHVLMLHANLLDERVDRLLPQLRLVQPRAKRPARKVPFRLSHLFWNTHPSQLELPARGPYIARRLLRTLDPAGLAWGAQHLRAEDWHEAARARGLSDAVRALAANLADAAEND